MDMQGPMAQAVDLGNVDIVRCLCKQGVDDGGMYFYAHFMRHSLTFPYMMTPGYYLESTELLLVDAGARHMCNTNTVTCNFGARI